MSLNLLRTNESDYGIGRACASSRHAAEGAAITIAGSLLLFSSWLFRFWLRAGNAGQHLIKSLLGRHLLGAALVVPVFVLIVTGTAAGLKHFFTRHGYHGMVSRPLASRTMVVNVVSESHFSSSMFS